MSDSTFNFTFDEDAPYGSETQQPFGLMNMDMTSPTNPPANFPIPTNTGYVPSYPMSQNSGIQQSHLMQAIQAAVKPMLDRHLSQMAAQVRAVFEKQDVILNGIQRLDARVTLLAKSQAEINGHVQKLMNQSESRKRQGDIGLTTGVPFDEEQLEVYQSMIDNYAITNKSQLDLVFGSQDFFELAFKLKLAELVREPRTLAPIVFQLVLPVSVLPRHIVGNLQTGQPANPNKRAGGAKKAFNADFNRFLGRLYRMVAGSLVAPSSLDMWYHMIKKSLNTLGDNLNGNNNARIRSIDYIYDDKNENGVPVNRLHPLFPEVSVAWIDVEASQKVRSRIVGDT